MLINQMGKVLLQRLSNIILTFLILLPTISAAKQYSSISSNITDQSTLLTLKAHITEDSNGILSQNWTANTSFCNWFGITCSSDADTNVTRRDGTRRVIGLDLSGMGLAGTIPSEIGNLSYIQYLNVSGNRFHGSLPLELGYLSRLRVLNLTVNEFEGEIPSSLGMLQGLQFLMLGNNSFTGSVPLTLFNISTLRGIWLTNNNLVGGIPGNICDHLPNIEVISLVNNHFSGHLPSSISKCQKLRLLVLGYNTFTGEIPQDIGMLSSFQVLDLSDNNITGMIPTSITNLTTVKQIILQHNHLSGTLPKDTKSWSSSLEVFTVTDNNISGHIWDTYCNLSSLQWLGLDDNNLHGSIPDCIGNLQNLMVLGLSSNMLTGIIPQSFSNLSMIQIAYLEMNQLTGPIPKDLGSSQPNLQYLYLNNNALTGTIPSSLSNATKLEQISLSFNQLTGSVPTFFGDLPDLQYLFLMDNYLTIETSGKNLNFFDSLTRCRNLELLWLNANPFNVTIPSSIGNFSSTLREIDMSDCKLHGGIPEEIGDLTSLTYLNLSHNDFSRSMIPATLGKLIKLQELYLESSGLEGKIPSELCLAEDIGNIHLHDNKLSGSIPSCLGNMTSLRVIRLDNNQLNSSIPAMIGSLGDLVRLNMAFNNLSGSLPSEIGRLKMVAYINLTSNQLSGTIPSTINGLQEITELYLSDNKFEGSLPEEIGKLLSLESLDLSHNDFSGVIPKGVEALSNLHYFNVSFNKLEGEIPDLANFTAQSFLGNPALCGPPRLQVPSCPKHSERRRKRKLIRVLKIALPLVVASALVMVLLVLLFTRKRVRNRDVKTGDHNLPTSQVMRRISYLELLSATNKFSETNLLGAGAFGSVYKALLPNSEVVAVKVFHMQMQESMRSFEIECEILKNIKHRNLVKVISSCSNLDFKALVLEYMPKGNLDELLHAVECDLNLMQRLNIMIDVASAIEYLHHGYSSPVVHRDLKPSNVLLDEDLVAHVSDFGLAKLLDEKDQYETMTKNMATIGYMAPEYGSGGLVSMRCDVYSFGVILMETFTGKRPTDEMFEGDTSLRCWVTEFVQHNNQSLIKIVDPRLLNEEGQFTGGNEQCVRSVMELALHCTDENPKARMNMMDILACLKKIHTVYCCRQEDRRHGQ